MGRSYRVKGTGKYLKQEEIDFSGKFHYVLVLSFINIINNFFLIKGEKPVEKTTKQPLVATWEKMSKSKFNGVEPESVWDEQGIDTTRLLILADVSPRSSRNWSKDSINVIILSLLFVFKF